jgi:hypothetical protein
MDLLKTTFCKLENGIYHYIAYRVNPYKCSYFHNVCPRSQNRIVMNAEAYDYLTNVHKEFINIRSALKDSIVTTLQLFESSAGIELDSTDRNKVLPPKSLAKAILVGCVDELLEDVVSGLKQPCDEADGAVLKLVENELQTVLQTKPIVNENNLEEILKEMAAQLFPGMQLRFVTPEELAHERRRTRGCDRGSEGTAQEVSRRNTHPNDSAFEPIIVEGQR